MHRSTHIVGDEGKALAGALNPSSSRPAGEPVKPSNSNTRPIAAASGLVDAGETTEFFESVGSLAVRITARFKRPSIKVFRSGEVGEDFPPSETLKTARGRDEEP